MSFKLKTNKQNHAYTYVNKDGNPSTKSRRHVKANANT
jgi:hypothetical protein